MAAAKITKKDALFKYPQSQTENAISDIKSKKTPFLALLEVFLQVPPLCLSVTDLLTLTVCRTHT